MAKWAGLCVFVSFFTTTLFGQVTLSSLPTASGGVVTVCAGSTVLFSNTTNPDQYNIFGTTEFDWDFGNNSFASTVGPHAITYAQPGTYEVSLSIESAGVDLGFSEVTVVVTDTPPFIPALGPGNACTQQDTLADGTIVFQTQSVNGCGCPAISGYPGGPGPAISILNSNTYPAGTISTFHWGSTGNSQNPQAVTTFSGFPTAGVNLTQFPGQNSPLVSGINVGHYAAQGSYNLMYLVTFPSGCTYSRYYVMSWGAGRIDFCANSAEDACNPLSYALCFDDQFPGNTYEINWGDGTPVESFTYPNLPIYPNKVTHDYPSSCENDTLTAFTISIEAVNICPNATTLNTQGPFTVSAFPQPAFEPNEPIVICQDSVLIFDNTSDPGFVIALGNCDDTYEFGWTVVQNSPTPNAGFTLVAGALGNLETYPTISGTDSLHVQFYEPGTYTVSLTAGNIDCGSNVVSKIVTVNPYPVVPNQTKTICSGQTFTVTPVNSPPTTIVPPGTTYTWTVQNNPNVSGESGGSGSSISGNLTNNSNVNQTVVYTVIPSAGPCDGPPFTVTVTVTPGILIPDATFAICSGSSISYVPANSGSTSIIPAGTTYSWVATPNSNVTGESSGSGSAINQTLTSTTPGVLQTVNYLVTAIGTPGCNGDDFALTVAINSVQAAILSDTSTICIGGNAPPIVPIFPGVAAGSISYQWQQAASPSGPWSNISGATNATYDPPSGSQADTYYRLVVTSTYGGITCSANSDIAVVWVNAISPATIGTEQVVCEGEAPDTLTVNVPATGDGTITYQWQSSGSATGPWSNLLGATGSSYIPLPNPPATVYYCVVATSTQNGVTCTANSNVVPVWLNTISLGTAGPNQTLCVNAIPGPVTAVVSGLGGLSYQWEMATSPSGPWSNIPGATSATYTPTQGITSSYYLRLRVTSIYLGIPCTEYSNTISILLNSVTASISPELQTICFSGDVNPISVTGSGNGTLSYSWQVSTVGPFGPWSTVSGVNLPLYDPPVGSIGTTSWFQVVVSGSLNGSICSTTTGTSQVVINGVTAGAIGSDQFPGEDVVWLVFPKGAVEP